MKIDQLPTDVLIEIFNLLPTYGQVSLVNKLFYGIACKVNDPNICLRIDERFSSNSKWLQSIKISRRKITKIEVLNLQNDQRNISVVRKFLPTVKYLKFENVITDKSTTILKMLPMAQNTKYLELCNSNIYIGDDNESSERRRCDGALKLDKLKSLCIFGWPDYSLQHLFERIPAGVLTELKISCKWSGSEYVLSRQLNIKKLCVSYYQERNEFATEIFDKLKLKSLELRLRHVKNVSIAKVFSRQTELKSLILVQKIHTSRYPNDEVMNAVTDLLDIEELAIDVSKVTTKSFVKIRKLKKLKDLTLICGNISSVAKIKKLAESDNISLTKLTLKWQIKIPPNVIASLAKSAPHLRQFYVLRHDSHRGDAMNERNAILHHFNFVEALSVVIWDKSLPKPSNYFNAKLKELSVDVFYGHVFFEQWLTILTAAYPNLRKLKLSIVFLKDHDVEIRPILDGFTQLESLSIAGYRMDIKDLNCINDLKYNLKFLSLKGLVDYISINEVIMALRPHFSVAIIDEYRTLNVATDQSTMNCERPSFN